MQLPIAIPLPFFFIFLLFKLVIILITPFALGAIVRLRSQGKRKETNSAQKSDKTNPPPSPGPDGEDKPEDSYWTRFKKWCSDHSVAIGLGVITLTMALIYVYREEISQLINGQDSPEQKKDTSPPPAEEEEKAIRDISAKITTRQLCDDSFFSEGETVNGESYVEKAQKFSILLHEIKEHYNAKEVTTELDNVIKRKIAVFEEKFPGLAAAWQADDEALAELAKKVALELSKDPKEWHQSFTQQLAFILRDESKPNSKKWYDGWYNIVLLYVKERIDLNQASTSQGA